MGSNACCPRPAYERILRCYAVCWWAIPPSSEGITRGNQTNKRTGNPTSGSTREKGDGSSGSLGWRVRLPRLMAPGRGQREQYRDTWGAQERGGQHQEQPSPAEVLVQCKSVLLSLQTVGLCHSAVSQEQPSQGSFGNSLSLQPGTSR